MTAWRTATTDYVFRMARPLLLGHACKVRLRLFGSAGVPPNTILMHIRWGDTRVEMDLVPMKEYISAASGIVERPNLGNVTVIGVTQGAMASDAFQRERPPEWTVVHMDMPYRWTPVQDILALVYVGLEARVYILTPGSNWSRVFDELRRTRMDYFCGGCTEMVDIRPGEY